MTGNTEWPKSNMESPEAMDTEWQKPNMESPEAMNVGAEAEYEGAVAEHGVAEAEYGVAGADVLHESDAVIAEAVIAGPQTV